MSTHPKKLAHILASAALAAAIAVPVAAASPSEAAASAPAAASASTAAGTGPAFTGTVVADGSAVRDATVRLFAAGATPGDATQLSTETTDRHGRFSMRVPDTVMDTDVLYATADGGTVDGSPVPATVQLATSLGDLRKGKIIINELTTVAAGYSLAQFAVDGVVGGPAPGLHNAARMPRNLVDIARGVPAKFLLQYPNGTSTETFSTFNSLASIVAGCVDGSNDCDAFLDAATDPWGVRPDTTWEAMTLLPTNPSGDAPGVFAQIPEDPRFTPTRSSAPSGWVIALRFYGNGHQFNGPGNVAFDAQGRVWANDNATVSPQPKKVCPGLDLFLLDPYSAGQPMQTFTGGGLNGAGFGIAIDPRSNVWVSNFGFTGSECPVAPTSNSVSEFDADGHPLSGDDGYLDGPLSWPQGIKSDVDGNIWIANCGNDSVVVYPQGDHAQAFVVDTAVPKAFDVAQNTAGAVFATANAGDQVYGFAPDGSPLPGSPFGDSSVLSKPLGAASDSLGNVWVSNSGVVDIPCSSGATLEAPAPGPHLQGTIAQVSADGSVVSFGGAGMTVPWGIAVDGDDNLWVANFAAKRLSHLCGARASTCPLGQTGAAISPADTGYSFDGLQRNTGVQIDPSGNVWLTNNWIAVPVQTDPFGDGLVVYLGMAAPVKAPLIGTPERP